MTDRPLVLVIDDDVTVRDVVTRYLDRAGYRVEVARNLLANAIRYTAPGGRWRRRRGQRGRARFCGGRRLRRHTGRRPATRVFDLAWRGTDARSPAAGTGAGLGLAIVRGHRRGARRHGACAQLRPGLPVRGGGCRLPRPTHGRLSGGWLAPAGPRRTPPRRRRTGRRGAEAQQSRAPAPGRPRRAGRRPGRVPPVTTGAGPPRPPPASRPARRRCAARRSTRCTAPAHPARGRAARRQRVGRRHVGDVHEVAPLRAVLEHPRRLAALQRGAEDRRDPGVRGVAGHPRAVHVVVAQRPHRAAGLPGPRRGQVLLRELRRGVGAARVERRVLRHQPGAQRVAAARAARLEPAGVQVGARAAARAGTARARRRRSGPRRRPPSTRPAPAGCTPARRASRRAAPRCRGRCARRTPARRTGRRRARPSPPGGRPRRRRAAAARAGPRRGRRRGRTRGRTAHAGGAAGRAPGEQRVEQDDLVPVGDQPVGDVRTDEAGAAGDQDAHHGRR